MPPATGHSLRKVSDLTPIIAMKSVYIHNNGLVLHDDHLFFKALWRLAHMECIEMEKTNEILADFI